MRRRRSSSGSPCSGSCSRSSSPGSKTTTPTPESTTLTRQPRPLTSQSTALTRRTTLSQTVTSPETTAVIPNNSARTPTAGNITRTRTTSKTSTINDATARRTTDITTKSQSVLMNRGEQEVSTHLHVVLIPTIIGLGIILTLLLCFAYRGRLRNNIRNVVNKLRKNKTDVKNFTTLNEEEGNSENPYFSSTYSVIENHVVVSPLPASRPSQQETVPQDENYSALDRRIEISETKKNENNDYMYDLLNHSNQPPMNSINVYSSTDPAFRSTEATLSNTYGVYQ